jgi:hypothetical protein
VRDSLGLTYDVSFEVTQFDIIRNGWYSVNVTSYPDKIHEALAASLSVLRELAVNPVNAWELMRAKNTVITRWVGRQCVGVLGCGGGGGTYGGFEAWWGAQCAYLEGIECCFVRRCGRCW